jgi:tetratricopeptide (TPR) repeat protein
MKSPGTGAPEVDPYPEPEPPSGWVAIKQEAGGTLADIGRVLAWLTPVPWWRRYRAWLEERRDHRAWSHQEGLEDPTARPLRSAWQRIRDSLEERREFHAWLRKEGMDEHAARTPESGVPVAPPDAESRDLEYGPGPRFRLGRFVLEFGPLPRFRPGSFIVGAAVALALLLPIGLAVLTLGTGSRAERHRRTAAGRPRPRTQGAKIAQLRAAAKQGPPSAGAHVQLADEYAREGEYARAVDEYGEALRIDPRETAALLGLARIARQTDEPGSATMLARRAAESNPQDPAAAHELGLSLAQGGQAKQAAAALDRAAGLAPDNLITLLTAAGEHARARQWREAESAARRAIAVAEKAPNVTAQASDFRLPAPASAPELTPQQRDDPAAREALVSACRQFLASILMEAGKSAEAFAELAALAGARPRDAGARLALGRVRLAQGKPAEALADFQEAQRLQPGRSEPYLAAGAAARQANDLAEAERQYRKALQTDPDSSLARLALATVQFARGDREGAIHSLEAALVSDPNAALVLNDLAFVYAEVGRNLDRAGDLARRATEMEPNSASLWDTRAWVSFRAGRIPDAIEQLRHAVQLDPKLAAAHYHLGKVQQAAGNPAEAAAAYRAALALTLSPERRSDAEAALVALAR